MKNKANIELMADTYKYYRRLEKKANELDLHLSPAKKKYHRE